MSHLYKQFTSSPNSNDSPSVNPCLPWRFLSSPMESAHWFITEAHPCVSSRIGRKRPTASLRIKILQAWVCMDFFRIPRCSHSALKGNLIFLFHIRQVCFYVLVSVNWRSLWPPSFQIILSGTLQGNCISHSLIQPGGKWSLQKCNYPNPQATS